MNEPTTVELLRAALAALNALPRRALRGQRFKDTYELAAALQAALLAAREGEL